MAQVVACDIFDAFYFHDCDIVIFLMTFPMTTIVMWQNCISRTLLGEAISIPTCLNSVLIRDKVKSHFRCLLLNIWSQPSSRWATQFWCFSRPHCRVKTITQKIYLGGKSNTGNVSWDILEKSDNKNFAGTSNPFLPGTQLVEPLVLMFWTTSGSTRTQTWYTRGETV